MRSRTLFLLAILMGLITTILFVVNMKQDKPETAVETILYTKVVVATSPILENQVITSDMIEYAEVPKDQVHEATALEMEDVVDKIAVTQIEPNEIILNHRVQSIEDEKLILSKKVTESSRGISIGLNIVQSVSNLMQPGDYVDVIHTKVGPIGAETTLLKSTGTLEDVTRISKEDESITKMIFSKVRVLAIGQKLTISKDAETITEFAEVTLELTPAETIKLVHAYETGNLHLTVHSSIITD